MLLVLIRKVISSVLVTYYEYKQEQFMEKLKPKLQKEKYTITENDAETFNKFQFYKTLLKAGHWNIYMRQRKNDKIKKNQARLYPFKRRNNGK